MSEQLGDYGLQLVAVMMSDELVDENGDTVAQFTCERYEGIEVNCFIHKDVAESRRSNIQIHIAHGALEMLDMAGGPIGVMNCGTGLVFTANAAVHLEVMLRTANEWMVQKFQQAERVQKELDGIVRKTEEVQAGKKEGLQS